MDFNTAYHAAMALLRYDYRYADVEPFPLAKLRAFIIKKLMNQ